MRHHRFILSILLLGSLVNISFAEHRFYPANGIRCTNVSEIGTDEYDPINRKYKVKRTYYHYYTGNDTIVEGKPCVMLWKYCADTPKEKELRFLCEEDGLISYKYPLADGSYSDWKILFEFPNGGWKEGEKFIDGYLLGKPISANPSLDTYTLLNGEDIQLCLGRLMYGLGYNDWPFFEFRDYSEGDNNQMQPYNFYRNDTLLWGKHATYGPFFPANSIRCTNMVTSMFNNDTIYYNLYTGSDTIVDGKECVQLWEYCTDTPEKLEQYLLHEKDDKVYVRYSASENAEWQLLYDFSLPVWHVGDSISIEDVGFGRLPIESVDTITLLNGKTRQVANLPMGCKLIYGMGYVGEAFFEPISRLMPPDGTVYHPVSFYRYNDLLWGKELPKKREERFFPANGVYTTNLYRSPRYDESGNEIERESIYYNKWTGNDTIVDERECVVVWHNREGVAKRFGVIYESFNGLVYFNYAGDEPYSPNYWLCLYDFTSRNWKVGDVICTNYDGTTEWYEEVKEVSSLTLQNGEEVSFIEASLTNIIYGIGYDNEPFLSPKEAYNGYTGRSCPINFYRNGELLWGEEYNPNTSITLPKVSNPDTPYYDLQGRKVTHPTRGIYIKDGAKVVIGD